MGELLQFDLAVNVTGFIEPTEPGSVSEKFQSHLTSTCLLGLLAAEYLHETNISIFYLIYCVLFFRCLEKGFEEERKKNKDGNNQGAATMQLP